MTPALKEWAVVVKAVAEGRQLVTLRKGGIREPNKHFALEQDRFFLFPTFDHQQVELVRSEQRNLLDQALVYGHWNGGTPENATSSERTLLPDQVDIDTWVEVAASFEISGQAELKNLEPFHIWSTDYAEKRLKWKPRHPLHLLVLRAYTLRQPVTIENISEYAGCKSWVGLKKEIPFEGKPVLTDQLFQERLTAVNHLQATVRED